MQEAKVPVPVSWVPLSIATASFWVTERWAIAYARHAAGRTRRDRRLALFYRARAVIGSDRAMRACTGAPNGCGGV